MLITLFYFFLALLLLVTVHEYGHFQVARWCGVKVLRFSFGFGPILAKLKDKKGTEYAFSLFPLGGYVKMLDEAEGEVAPEEQSLAFNNQALWKRILIVAAGPFFNFLFAFFALWLVFLMGIKSLAPIIDSVSPNSVAAKAGLKSEEEIIRLNQTAINSWRDFQYAMMPLMGSDEKVTLLVQSLKDKQQRSVQLSLANWHLDNKKPDLLKNLGIMPFLPVIPPVVGEVVVDSPAAKAGLQVHDKILSVDGQPFTDWLFLVDYVRARPNQTLQLLIEREGMQKTLSVSLGSQQNQGVLGVRSEKPHWPVNWFRYQKQGPLEAMGSAFTQSVQLIKTTFILMGRLVTGKLGLDSLSGPVGIAQGAGDSGRGGVSAYLFFLALVSVSLGVLNLLPIPMLDGGHLLYYFWELVTRKPVSETAKAKGAYLGLLFLMVLMGVSLVNDLMRLTD